MAKAICKLLGVVFLLVGLLGFISPKLLGMHLSGIHNIIHLISAALALYFGFAASPSAARAFSLIFGAIYLLIGFFGVFSVRDSMRLVPGLIEFHLEDEWIQIATGLLFSLAFNAR